MVGILVHVCLVVYLTPVLFVSRCFQRKKRAAPEVPAEDQQADPALYYNNYWGYPYTGYGFHFLKKREAPAEDQQADPALYYNNYW